MTDKTKSVLQDWVMKLGLRHQGVLLAAIRGCDNAPKNDPTKDFVRCFRGMIMNPFCGDAKKCASFIESVTDDELEARFVSVRRNCDQYPLHYMMHLTHAIEIVGYCYPHKRAREIWHDFYCRLVRTFHMNPESFEEMTSRLTANEEVFGKAQSDNVGG